MKIYLYILGLIIVASLFAACDVRVERDVPESSAVSDNGKIDSLGLKSGLWLYRYKNSKYQIDWRIVEKGDIRLMIPTDWRQLDRPDVMFLAAPKEDSKDFFTILNKGNGESDSLYIDRLLEHIYSSKRVDSLQAVKGVIGNRTYFHISFTTSEKGRGFIYFIIAVKSPAGLLDITMRLESDDKAMAELIFGEMVVSILINNSRLIPWNLAVKETINTSKYSVQ